MSGEFRVHGVQPLRLAQATQKILRLRQLRQAEGPGTNLSSRRQAMPQMRTFFQELPPIQQNLRQLHGSEQGDNSVIHLSGIALYGA